jgi:hypothetical protein
MPNESMFRYVSPTGEVLATGPLSLLNDQLAARRTAEGAIRAAALAADSSHRARADSLDQREAAIEARERQADAAAIKAFCDGVEALSRRMGALEESRRQEDLATEIRQADEALKGLEANDDGPAEIKLPSAERDRDEIGCHDAKSAIASADGDDDDQTLPGQREFHPTAPAARGELPEQLAKDDVAEFGRVYLMGRDRRAARKAARLATRR